MRKIRMYRIGFGDCCVLRSRGRNLVVDFGTSNQKIGTRSRGEVFERIWKDLETIPRKDLLLTGFLPSHTQGIVTMWNQEVGADSFGTVYLPDLFSGKEGADLLAMLLLADMMEESYLPGKQVSLLYFLRTLVKQPARVVLLRRGDEFGGRYRTLWPDVPFLSGEIHDVMRNLNQQELFAWRQLMEQAENLRGAMLRYLHDSEDMQRKEDGAEDTGTEQTAGKAEETSGQTCRKELMGVQEGLNRLRQNGALEKLNTAFSRVRVLPQRYRDRTSLCFQNASDGEWNLLFAGDISPDLMERIMLNKDETVPAFEHYWCIKVPHHGTASHYFDFRDWSPDIVLISNGQYYPDEKWQEKACRVSAQYAGLFYIPDATMICAENGCCEGNQNGCSCLDYEIISPGLYKDL